MDEPERHVLFLQARRFVLPEHAVAGGRASRAGGAGAAGAVARQGSRFRVRRALYSAGFGWIRKRSGAVEARQRDVARSWLSARWRRSEAAERQSVHNRVSRFLAGAATAHDAVRTESGETRDRGGFADRRCVTI